MPVFLYTPKQVLVIGLGIAGCSHERQLRVSSKTNLDHFEDAFGVHPKVCAKIWEDLQTTTVKFGPNNDTPARIDMTSLAPSKRS